MSSSYYADRIGDIFLLGEEHVVFGNLEKDPRGCSHPLTRLEARSHSPHHLLRPESGCRPLSEESRSDSQFRVGRVTTGDQLGNRKQGWRLLTSAFLPSGGRARAEPELMHDG